jgi:hypothetical protein
MFLEAYALAGDGAWHTKDHYHQRGLVMGLTAIEELKVLQGESRPEKPPRTYYKMKPEALGVFRELIARSIGAIQDVHQKRISMAQDVSLRE